MLAQRGERTCPTAARNSCNPPKNGGYVKEETGEKIVPETFVGIGDTHHQKGNGKGEKKKKGFIRGEKEREKGVKPTHSGGKENPALFQRSGLQLSR